MIVRRDGGLVSCVRVEAAPFLLLSDREKDRRIGAFFEAVQGLPGRAQIVSLPRPLDLDAYLRELETQLLEASGARKTALRGYLSYVRNLVAGGTAVERRYYVLISWDGRQKGAQEELSARTREFLADLARADLTAHLSDDREVLDLLFYFFNPAQAAFERPVEADGAPVYSSEKGGEDDGSS